MGRHFRDNHGNDVSPVIAVFPILHHTGTTTKFIGTGFFVNPAGVFMTAKHVLPLEKEKYQQYYVLQSLPGNYKIVRPIQAFFAADDADIGIGILKGELRDRESGEIKYHTPLTISLDDIRVGDEIRTFVYPLTTVQEEDSEVSVTVKGDWEEGIIIEHLPEGRPFFPNECYRTSITTLSGASGGPVIGNGLVIGVNSTGMDVEEGAEPISYFTPISQVFDLQVHDSDGKVTTVRELMESGHVGSLRKGRR